MVATIENTIPLEERAKIVMKGMPQLAKLENAQLITELAITIADEVLEHILFRAQGMKRTLNELDQVTLMIITCSLAGIQLDKNVASLGKQVLEQIRQGR